MRRGASTQGGSWLGLPSQAFPLLVPLRLCKPRPGSPRHTHQSLCRCRPLLVPGRPTTTAGFTRLRFTATRITPTRCASGWEGASRRAGCLPPGVRRPGLLPRRDATAGTLTRGRAAAAPAPARAAAPGCAVCVSGQHELCGLQRRGRLLPPCSQSPCPRPPAPAAAAPSCPLCVEGQDALCSTQWGGKSAGWPAGPRAREPQRGPAGGPVEQPGGAACCGKDVKSAEGDGMQPSPGEQGSRPHPRSHRQAPPAAPP